MACTTSSNRTAELFDPVNDTHHPQETLTTLKNSLLALAITAVSSTTALAEIKIDTYLGAVRK